MRLAHPFTRALVSICFTLFLAGLMLLPAADMPALARPQPQAASPTATTGPTPTVDPASPVDLIPESPQKYGNVGTTITYSFTIFNNATDGCPGSGIFTITTTSSNGSFDVTSPGSRNVAPGGSATFTVTVLIESGTPPGSTGNITVQVFCQANQNISDSAIVAVTATVNNSLPTATPTVTQTPVPTGTTGPTPTPGPICIDPFEPDNLLGQANEILPDVPQNHTICPKGDEDFLYFGGIAGKVYTIDILAMDNGIDLTLSLYDEAGNLLAFNNDFPRNNDASDIKPRIQSWRAPANGRYYIKVRDDAGRGGTDLKYSIELQSESYGPTPTLVRELCTDLFEPDGVPEQARLVVIREVQPNHRFCPAGDADWVRFFAKTGQRYTLRVDSQSRPGADPVMILVDRDGATILDFNDDSGGTLDPRIEFQPIVDGFYFAQLKNVGDIGSQFIAYDFYFEPAGVATTPTTTNPTTNPTNPTTTATTGTETTTATTGTVSPTRTPGPTPTQDQTQIATIITYPEPTQTAVIGQTQTAVAGSSFDGVKGAPTFVNGPSPDFVDPSLRNVWSRTDQVVASRQVDRSWMWGPSGLVARAEVYSQSNGGARQVQYFDKARMEISDWSRDRNNPWFVTNGLLVKELIEGQLQIGDAEFIKRAPAQIAVAGDADYAQAPTYASFAKHTGRAADRTGQMASATLRRDGSTGTLPESAVPQDAARIAHYVSETGHNIPQVFWDFLNARGPVGSGQQNDVLVDWVFAMGYPVSEPYWTKVKIGGTERDVLVQAFQRRVLTYTPTNPDGWKVEMGNVGRHYYTWRYGRQP